MRKSLVAVALLASLQASTILTSHADKRLSAKIASSSMNRISVVNDRITQVFGDDQTYSLQTEDATGQVFIKPTADNGKEPISLTLITENGLTQDLYLEPVLEKPATLIIKKPTAATPSNAAVLPQAAMPFGDGASSFKPQLISAMKVLVSNQGTALEGEEVKRKVPAGLHGNFQGSYSLGNFTGYIWQLQNTNKAPVALFEKDFYKQGDLAISLDKQVLIAGETTNLYVVVR